MLKSNQRICLYLILWLSLTSAGLRAETNTTSKAKLYDPAKWETETLIEEKEEAPISGVLVPAYNYRVYQKSLNMLEGVSIEMESLAEDCIEERSTIVLASKSGWAITFSLGVLIGLGAATFAK